MREIKFRVWCEHHNGWEQHGIYLCEKGGMYHGSIRNLCNPKTHILEFYTGLKDKSGREIYEEDLLQSQIGDKHIWRVLFEDGSFILEQIAGYKHRGQDFCCRDDIDLYQLVVIGNIHENPDLLGGGA